MKILIIAVFLLIGISNIKAQTRSTKETKVVLIVNKETNRITKMEFFDAKKSKNRLSKKYTKSKFYYGVLKGSFKVNKEVVEPMSGAIIIMYTDKQLFSDDKFVENANITIGKLKTKIVSRKKGELTVKVN